MAVITTRGGHRLHVDADDGRAQALIGTAGEYNAGSLELWRKLVASGRWDAIVDVGANYGEMLVEIPPDSAAEVVAFEPHPAVAGYLERTVADAGLEVTIVRQALSDSQGPVSFLVDTEWSGRSRLATLAGVPSTLEPLTVEATTLDAYFLRAEHRRMCLKIDVEGGERAVLDGGRALFSRLDELAVMVEVLHLSTEDVRQLARDWRMYLLDLRTKGLLRVVPDASLIDGLRSAGWCYTQDAVLVPNPPAGRRPW